MTILKRLNLRMPVGKMPLIVAALALLSLLVVACGVTSGDRRPARQDDSVTDQFHRTPVTALEQFRMDLSKDDTSCAIAEIEDDTTRTDIEVTMGGRVSMGIQLPLEEGQMGQGATKSIVVTGERQRLQFKIDGLQLSAPGGAFATGTTEFDITMEAGARKTYHFNTANSGAFDMLCDGAKIGTFTVNPA